LNTATVAFTCPWCGTIHAEILNAGAETEMICGGGVGDKIFKQGGCKKPIRIVTFKNGDIKSVLRSTETNEIAQSQQSAIQRTDIRSNGPSINIGNVYGAVSIGGNATVITNIYNETIKAIEQAKDIEPERKQQAKGILDHVKTWAPPFMPVIADAIRKSLGLG
jgi:hypothetical protein